MMMETAPPAPFIITKAEFLLELLVVALDPPPQLCQVDQTIKGGIFGQGGKPILDRLGFVSRPLDQNDIRYRKNEHRTCLAVRARRDQE